MATFRYSEMIDRTPDEVFDFVMDFSHAALWRSLVRRMEVVGGGEVRAGSDIVVTFDVMGRQRDIVTHVTAVQRPTLFSFWNENDGFRGEFRYEVAATPSGSRVAFTGDVRPMTWKGWLVMPWVRKQARARYGGQLSSLRRAMERTAARR